MYKYILFDLDGTISDPKQGICTSVQYALKKCGIEPPDIDELTAFIGPPLKDSFMEFYRMNEEDALKAVGYYRERFGDVGWSENEIYPGIPELLKEAKAKGARLAIASSKPTVFVEKILKYFKINRYFDVVIGSELDGSRSKKEEIVEEALKQLYAKGSGDTAEKKALTAMVGDRKFDIEGARAQDVDAIGVSYGYQEPGELSAAGADAIAATVDELKELLLGGEDKEIRDKRLKRIENDEKTDLPKVPTQPFLRALYMLSPFVVYFVVLQIMWRVVLWLTKPMAALSSGKESRPLSVLISILVMGTTALILWLIYRRREYMHFLPLWKKKDVLKKVLYIIVMGAALSALLNMLLTWAAQLIVPHIMSGANVKKFFDAATYDRTTPLWEGIVLYVLISPLLEELVFRWLLKERIGRVFSREITIVLTAVFFGFYHGNVLQGIYAFLMGLVMGHLVYKEEALIAPLLFHMTANAFIFISSYFS